jgi:2-dehydropantoate 2-reductase
VSKLKIKLAAFLAKNASFGICLSCRHQPRQTEQHQSGETGGIGIGSSFPLSKRIAAEFKRANLKPKLIEDTKGMKWSKMISNLLANASSAILNMTPAEIFTDSISYKLEIRQLRETLDVMRAYGIQPVDIPGVPIRLLCFAVRHFRPGLSNRC